MAKPLFILHKRSLKQIDPEAIVCLVTENNYTHINMADKSCYMVRSSLMNTMKLMPKDMFVRIHRSCVVAVAHISHIHKDHVIVYEVILPMAKQYYDGLMKMVTVIR
jgi:DNA-binding LytR/AlgR family response regulator